MRDTVPTPVPGNPDSKGAPDGVSATPGGAGEGVVHGRSEAGESGGGAYPNPKTGHGDPKNEFFSARGQTPNLYHGGGQAGEDGNAAPNAAAGSDGRQARSGHTSAPAADRTERSVDARHGTFAIVETSGVAEAETQGKIATDAPYENEQKQPGSG